MKQIIVATDFSTCAENAMRYAIEIATRMSAEITVLHFAHPTQVVDNNVWNAYFMEDLLEAKREALDSWVAKFSYPDLVIKSSCQVDFLPSGIAEHIAENPSDLLVLGSTGASGIAGILGSNAASVVAHTLLPTLIVPIDAVYEDNPVLVFASDLKPISSQNADILRTFADTIRAEVLDVLHVCPDNDTQPKTEQEQQLQAALGDMTLTFNYLNSDDVADAIGDFINNNDIGILCTIAHQHTFLHRLFHRSRVKAIVQQMVKPVLVLHG